MQKVRWARVGAVVAGAAMLAVATLPSMASAKGVASAKPVTGGTWTIGMPQEITTLDPVKGTVGGASQGATRQLSIFSSYLKYDSKKDQVIPGLALSLTSPDATVWTLKLRPNLKFTDNTPLDAEAVVFNLNRMKDPANGFPGIATVSQITKLTAIDSTTVEIRLNAANGSFPIAMSDIPGSPGSPTAIKADPSGWGVKNPVGAGPYMLKEWTRDQQMVLVRNPNYWDKPRPYIDTLIWKVYPNPNTMTEALRAGDIDGTDTANPQQLQVALENKSKLTAWDPNKVNGTIGIICNLDKTPCNDSRFREALKYSFDFNLTKQVFLNGVGYTANKLVCPPFGPDSPFCAKDIKTVYNPEKAKKLFAEVKADGINTDLEFTFNFQGILGVPVGEYVQQQLAKVGVNAKIRSVTTVDFVTLSNQGNYQTNLVYNQRALGEALVARFYNDWHSAGGVSGGRDVARLNNAQLDLALEKARNSLKLSDRVEGAQEAQRILFKENLVTWVWPFVGGTIFKNTLQLPSYVSPNAYYIRYDEAWIKPQK